MAGIVDNKAYWDGRYHWSDGGDEWSRPWGGVPFQWYCTLLPRIHGVVPTGTILEIGCGYGRWTQFLQALCDRLIAVDLSERCIEACRKRFSRFAHIEYHLNDGRSLEIIPDDSADFVFSFDSLVHADPATMEAYLSQLGRILTRDGLVFVHHSNLGEYRWEQLLSGPDTYLHLRDPGVSAELVDGLARENGLSCISQEVIHWRTSRVMIDCISTLVKQRSSLDRPKRVLRNKRFMDEAENALQMSRLYDSTSHRFAE